MEYEASDDPWQVTVFARASICTTLGQIGTSNGVFFELG